MITIATAKKLPSGSWRCRVFSHKDSSGKKVYKSFTVSDPTLKGKRTCEAMAAEWAAEKEQESKNVQERKTTLIGKALKDYVDLRENILSPTTFNAYTSYINSKKFEKIENLRVDTVSPDDIQSLVNDWAAKYRPHYVANIYSFLRTVLEEYNPKFKPNIKLPAEDDPEIFVPLEEEMIELIKMVKGTNMELPILLAAFGPVRRGEISAIEASDINGTTVHICKNMVKKKGGDWRIKPPKTRAGDRYIVFPDFMLPYFQNADGRLVKLCPDTITKNFIAIRNKLGLPDFHFHSLRHYSASIQHALGICDADLMKRGGWGDDKTLQRVYRHSMRDKAKASDVKANEYFSNTFMI